MPLHSVRSFSLYRAALSFVYAVTVRTTKFGTSEAGTQTKRLKACADGDYRAHLLRLIAPRCGSFLRLP